MCAVTAEPEPDSGAVLDRRAPEEPRPGFAGVAEFEAVYDELADTAFGIAMRICRDRMRAEDAVQDAFLAVWRHRADYDARRGSRRAWVLGIVRHRAIDLVRQHGVRARHGAEFDDVEYVAADGRQTEDQALDGLRADAVRRALRTLPPDQRRVIELAFYAGLTHREITAAIGAPLGTVKGRMRLALAKLAATLA